MPSAVFLSHIGSLRKWGKILWSAFLTVQWHQVGPGSRKTSLKCCSHYLFINCNPLLILLAYSLICKIVTLWPTLWVIVRVNKTRYVVQCCYLSPLKRNSQGGISLWTPSWPGTWYTAWSGLDHTVLLSSCFNTGMCDQTQHLACLSRTSCIVSFRI